ncbi:MAG: hypothetical protein KKG75_05570 [Nanoarchaeota archaeon]|nr:hypothetical protein [Nanoarchaeota archaeon]
MDQKDKNIFLTIAIVVLVALVAFNFEKITGGAITEPSSLSVFQEGKRITVQVNYPPGKYGRSNNVVDMKVTYGSKRSDQTTKCDPDRGYVARGNSKCLREIAVFDISGDTWEAGEEVIFGVRGTNIERTYRIR